MSAPSANQVRGAFGYHPIAADLPSLAGCVPFAQLLVFGPQVPDVVEALGEVRQLISPPVQLPRGIYWFCGNEPSAMLMVASHVSAMQSTRVPTEAVEPGSPLENALAWFDECWDEASAVPAPQFGIGANVVIAGTGVEGVVRPGRMFIAGRWLYQVFTSGQELRLSEDSLTCRPMAGNPARWVEAEPERPGRFAATLTRAKLDGHFTDTMFSFRATRTLFRPYQFKPVQKLLDTSTLRLLIADEVGLGKTIEAGLVWTELEARRQADRVLVLCPSALVSKWQREMEERFGFQLVELDGDRLWDLVDQLERGQLPKRIAYVCSIERLRAWDGLERATELDLDFDLAIVDEAHAFRNSDTKSYRLGEMVSEWAEALVMLSATPVNLRNGDLFNLLGLLVPDEFEDLQSLEERLAPNLALNKVVRSLRDSQATNAQRLGFLEELKRYDFGRVLMARPDFQVLREILMRQTLLPADAVAVKRICAELHALSGQVSRTRKVEVQEAKPVREPHMRPVIFNEEEQRFYNAYLRWCRERAAVTGSPLHFAMQMPLRLAGSCLPEAARSVLEWNATDRFEDEGEEDRAVPAAKSASVPPSAELLERATALTSDTKFDDLVVALNDLVRQEKQCILFTFSRRSLRYLEERLRGDFRIAALHGGVAKRIRDSVMADFRRGRYDVVLATRVASEGLDFEFCSAVVNYDLPWNPMEVEQRIGRIDRIGQIEQKLAILNFSTPGTIEADIIERVMLRIGVFEHAIGELEPILATEWRWVEDILFDFSLSPEQREKQAYEALLVVEEKAKALEDVESAAPVLVSSDGADIDGLEGDLLGSGRYVGQEELALLVTDWAHMFGGNAERHADVLRIRGNATMADHLQALVRSGERRGSEVGEIAAQLRAEQELTVSLDQEVSRAVGLDLLTATHPLTRAAASTPGYRQGRFALLQMDPKTADVPVGAYLTLLTVCNWDGLRPLHEVWSSTVDLATLSDAGAPLGLAVMKELARANLKASALRSHDALAHAVEQATINLEVRAAERQDELRKQNDAFLAVRRLSFDQVHARRMHRLEQTLATNLERGNRRVVPASRARIARQEARYAAQISGLERKAAPSLSRQDLAVCVIEVRP